MTEHQRFDTVAPNHPCLTPNVEKLAKEGVTFEQHYTPMAHCCPARASFFSGLYPSRHGVYNNVLGGQAFQHGLNPGIRLWNEDLIDVDYQCAIAGKWHISAEEWPRDRGWKELDDNMEERISANLTSEGQDKIWERLGQLPGVNNHSSRGAGEIVRSGYQVHKLYATMDDSHSCKRDRITVDAAEAQLDEYLQGDNPWCLYVGTAGAHTPYNVPKKYVEMYDLNDIPLPKNYHDSLEDKPNYYRKLREMTFGQLSEEEVRDAIRHYWAMCTFCDELFGQLLSKLDASGQAEDTIVIYVSDHGDYAGDHGLFHKGVPAFDAGYHVPMLIRWPEGIKNPGRSVSSFTDHTDIGPTMLDAAGLSQRDFPGSQSLLPLLEDDSTYKGREEVFFQCNGTENYFTARGVKNKDFKYVYNGYDFDELYDLRIDPEELINVQADPEYQTVKEELMQKIWKFAHQQKDTLGTCSYIMFQTAPLGPSSAFDDTKTKKR